MDFGIFNHGTNVGIGSPKVVGGCIFLRFGWGWISQTSVFHQSTCSSNYIPMRSTSMFFNGSQPMLLSSKGRTKQH
jgi:hypothetical protein